MAKLTSFEDAVGAVKNHFEAIRKIARSQHEPTVFIDEREIDALANLATQYVYPFYLERGL